MNKGLIGLMLLATTPAWGVPPGPGWGVLEKLVGTRWSSPDQSFAFRWKVPGEVMIVTNGSGDGAVDLEFRLGKDDGRIAIFYKDSQIGRIDLPDADSWQQSTAKGKPLYTCQVREATQLCEQFVSKVAPTFTLERQG